MGKPDIPEPEPDHDDVAVRELIKKQQSLSVEISNLLEAINDCQTNIDHTTKEIANHEKASAEAGLELSRIQSALCILDPENFEQPIAAKKPFRLTICVDFDGVLHGYESGWQGIDVIPDEPVDGAIDWLTEFTPKSDDYEGPEVVIYSSRSKEARGIVAMKNWLFQWGYPRHYITKGYLKFPTQKPAAFLTIDDRAICFDGDFPTREAMQSFKPWNK